MKSVNLVVLYFLSIVLICGCVGTRCAEQPEINPKCFLDGCEKWFDSDTGIVWGYSILHGKTAIIDGVQLPKTFSGTLEVPDRLGDCPVKSVRKMVLSDFDVTALVLPETLEQILYSNASGIWMSNYKRLHNKFVPVRTIETINIPAGMRDQKSIVGIARNLPLKRIEVSEKNPWYISKGGIVFDRDVTRVVACPSCIAQIDIPATVLNFDFIWGASDELQAIHVEEGHPKLRSIDGVLYDKDAQTLFCCPGSRKTYVAPPTLTAINGGAFVKCRDIEVVEMPASLRKIGGRAFKGCEKLKSFVMPPHATNVVSSTGSIGSEAFEGCLSLASFDASYFGRSIEDRAFAGCTNLSRFAFSSNLRQFRPEALEGTVCYQHLPEGPFVRGGRLYGVKDGHGASSVVVSNNVSEIAERAFRGMYSLEHVDLADSVTNIMDYAFLYCNHLRTLTIRGTLKGIGRFAFARCESLREIRTPATNDEMLQRALKGESLTAERSGDVLVVAPMKKESKFLPRNWQDPSTGITWHFVEGETSASLHLRCVDSSTSGDLVVPEYLNGLPVTYVHWSAFDECTNLTSITFPKTVAVNRMNAELSKFPALTNVTFIGKDGSVRYSGRFVMSDGCLNNVCAGGTKRIDIPEGVKEIVFGCLRGASWIEDVHIPSSVTEVQCGTLATKGVVKKHDPEGRGYVVIDGWMIPHDHVTTHKFIVPSGVRHIAQVYNRHAMRYIWPKASEVELPEGLLTIGTGAFSDSGIDEVVFPSTLVRCHGFDSTGDVQSPLRKITLKSCQLAYAVPDSVQCVEYAKGVTNLTSNLRNGKGVISVILPQGLQSITTFPSFPNLTCLMIPGSVTNIDPRAFIGCAGLTNVVIETNGSRVDMPFAEFRVKWNLADPKANRGFLVNPHDRRKRLRELRKPQKTP